MPKLLNTINAELIFLLRKEICMESGFEIRSKSDCLKLSENILQKTGASLSESTLYRFFFKKDDRQCYQNTLDKLSVYCNTKNWDAFCQIHENSLSFLFRNGIFLQNNENKSLIRLCIQNDELKSLCEFFEDLPDNLNEPIRRAMGIELYLSLLSNKNSNQNFYKLFSKINPVRKLLFEELADPDFKIKDYPLFYKWYLKNSKNLDKPDGLQDYIFANSMLFRHYVKKESLLDILKTGRLLFENKDIDRRVLHNIHVFPLSRWYSYRVWYSYHNRFKNYDESLFELIEFCKQISEVGSNLEKSIVLYNAIDVLSSVQEITLIQEELIPRFSQIIPLNLLKSESYEKLLKRLEPNGLKRALMN
jgi:hypothetical protein